MYLPANRIASDYRDQPGERRWLPVWPTFAVLYLVGVALLAYRLDARPASAYNWEAYTLRGLIDFAHRPSWEVPRLNDGLMTDSGRSVVVVGPAWLGFELIGQSLLGLRLPLVLVAALSVPLTWLLGRRLYSDAVGMTAALLLATSQVFLLYGRTGTNVGLSITVALIGYLVLWQCLRLDERHWPRWLISLQLALVASSYCYGVIRFLWLIALVLFALELLARPGERSRFLMSFGVTVVALPIALVLLLPGPIGTPVEAVERYYNGRQEHIFAIKENQQYLDFLRPDTAEERAEIEAASRDELARRLLTRNARDLANLLLDRKTLPAVTDYWNPNGRLYPFALVPLFVAGLAMLLWRFLQAPEARFVLALFFGYSLPLILTSQVHIGRLIFALPLLMIGVALPIGPIAHALARAAPAIRRARIRQWAGFALGAIIVVIGARANLEDWRTPFPALRVEVAREHIAGLAPPSGQVAYVFGDHAAYEIESLRIADLEILMEGDVRFTDLVTGTSRGSGSMTLLYGGVLELVTDPARVPAYCTNLYLVEPGVLERFLELSEPVAERACGRELRYEVIAEYPLN